MSFFTDLESVLSRLVSAAKVEIITLEAKFKPLIIADAETLGKSALSAVLAQAPLVLSGTEKLSAAVSTVVSSLTAQGKQAALSLIEVAVQTAYNEASASLKGN